MRRLLGALVILGTFALGYWIGRVSKPPEVVLIPEYRYFPMPTDCSHCKKL